MIRPHAAGIAAILIVIAFALIAAAAFWLAGNRDGESAPSGAASRSGSLAFAWGLAGLSIEGAARSEHNDADGIGVDNEGNVYVAGVFNGTIAIGAEMLESRGAGDIFILRLNRDGTLAWVKQFGGAGDDNAYDLDVGPGGMVVMNGWFAETVSFDDHDLFSAGGQDQFVVRLDPAGKVVWAKRFGGARGDGGNEVTVGDDGAIYATAITQGPYAAGAFSFDHQAKRDSYLLKLSSEGEVLWARGTRGSGSQRLRAVAIGEDGTVYGGYELEGEFKLEEHTHVSRGKRDGAIAAWTPGGDLLSVAYITGEGDDNVRGIARGPDRSVYVTGIWGDGANAFGRTLGTTRAGIDAYVARMEENGALAWLMTMGPTSNGQGGEIESDDRGTAYFSTDVVGELGVEKDGTPVAAITGPGERASLLLAIDPAGTIVSHITPDDSTMSGGQTLGVSPDGTRIATSNFFFETVAYGVRAFSARGAGKNFLIAAFSND